VSTRPRSTPAVAALRRSLALFTEHFPQSSDSIDLAFPSLWLDIKPIHIAEAWTRRIDDVEAATRGSQSATNTTETDRPRSAHSLQTEYEIRRQDLDHLQPLNQPDQPDHTMSQPAGQSSGSGSGSSGTGPLSPEIIQAIRDAVGQVFTTHFPGGIPTPASNIPPEMLAEYYQARRIPRPITKVGDESAQLD
jgi:hypothetical protein